MFANLFSKKNNGNGNGNGKYDYGKNVSVPIAQTGDIQSAIQMRDLVKIYRNAAGDFPALRGINTDFYEGEFVAVVGKSGSGKSTLVNMITGIDRPTSGDVIINGTAVNKLNENRMAIWRGRNLGIVFQFFQLLPMLSLLENVMLPMDFCDMYAPAERESRALELLKLVGMVDYAHKMPAAVSGGQQQAAAIARALANDPPFLVADEPTGNLDTRTAENVFQIFEGLIARGKTIIMVTHDNSLADRTTRTLLISDGEIINDSIATALPMLSHKQMLKATQKLRSHTFEPGMTIIEKGTLPHEAFYIVSQGQVEIAVQDSRGREFTVRQLKAGEFFANQEILNHKEAFATVRAASASPVELLAFDQPTFEELIAEADAMRETVLSAVQKHRQQTLAAVQS